uniref:Uncharacterized protein n=1 Tax=Anguilla anguilla TaxID=7936 RepID=A0A0E9URM5_ANGAN
MCNSYWLFCNTVWTVGCKLSLAVL